MFWRMAIISVLGLLISRGGAEAACESVRFDEIPYSVCTFDLRTTRLALFNLDAKGQPLGSFQALRTELDAHGKALTFAMNAGMFDDALRPIGLYIEDGKLAKKLNRRKGPGNFHMQPNGVFYLSEGKAGIAETGDYAQLKIAPDFATQSGPMLVIDGRLHPAFSASGTSRKIRNGVGVTDDHTVVFAISETGVTFHEFASLFRDWIKSPNALFFDGSVSSLYSPELGRADSFVPLGPMVGAFEMK